ncbi:transposable element Tcb2 transposase [Trichonephila clavipes]|nr:transposable element Tcb2 transposase [Trichonephila clavipes]
MSSRHHIDDFMRGRIIGKIEEGRKITDVAREFDIAHSVVSRLWNKKEQAHHSSADGKSVSCCLRKADLPKTVARRLRGGGLYARRPVVCVPLTRQHRTARLQWCREHHNWTEQDWACVLFSDESRFSLSSDCRRQLIWRESGTAYRPENIQEKDRYPTCSIMVWAGILINCSTRLHVVANGTMTGQRYIDEVLLPHVRLFRGAVGDKFDFMDDNATCHRTLAVQDCLDSEGIQRLIWPARSPDLNPIENVWDALGRQVVGRNYPPTNKNTLIRALTEEWDKLPQKLLDNVVQSMFSSIKNKDIIQQAEFKSDISHGEPSRRENDCDVERDKRFRFYRREATFFGQREGQPKNTEDNENLKNLKKSKKETNPYLILLNRLDEEEGVRMPSIEDKLKLAEDRLRISTTKFCKACEELIDEQSDSPDSAEKFKFLRPEKAQEAFRAKVFDSRLRPPQTLSVSEIEKKPIIGTTETEQQKKELDFLNSTSTKAFLKFIEERKKTPPKVLQEIQKKLQKMQEPRNPT